MTSADAITSTSAAAAAANTNGDLVATFRQKAAFMKNWKPASVPSNRDRLELYAWHKQAVSGDAPVSLQGSTAMTAAEKAKYAAWRGKSGTDSVTAMRNYVHEAERQVRVYGYAPPPQAAVPEQPERTTAASSGGSNSSLERGGGPAASAAPPQQASRGLAAIPLLCAAASEQRPAYLRRLQSTPAASAWWRRQEPLTATPGSLAALPEQLLLWVAAVVEHISLAANTEREWFLLGTKQLPPSVAAVLQSALWPLHNALLAVWMGFILIAAVVSAAVELAKTVLLGSRRTGRTLSGTWNDEVVFAAHSVRTLTEPHQPVSARVVGLFLQPLPLAVAVIRTACHDHAHLAMACLYVAFVVSTLWYWVVVLPWFLTVVMLGTALLLGNCFGIIELAGQI